MLSFWFVLGIIFGLYDTLLIFVDRYIPSLIATFTFPQSLGILGGKPGASTYIVGIQEDKGFYLDPHEVQQVSFLDLRILRVET